MVGKDELLKIAININNIGLYTFVSEYDTNTIPDKNDMKIYLATKWNQMCPKQQLSYQSPPRVEVSEIPGGVVGEFYTRVSFSYIRVGENGADGPSSGGPVGSYARSTRDTVYRHPIIHVEVV